MGDSFSEENYSNNGLIVKDNNDHRLPVLKAEYRANWHDVLFQEERHFRQVRLNRMNQKSSQNSFLSP
jgi:hypothetical protein